MIKQFLGKTILGKFSRREKKIKKHEPNLKEISKDSHEYKIFSLLTYANLLLCDPQTNVCKYFQAQSI